MATGVGLALPEPLHDDDALSWFKRYEVCVAANGWNDQTKLLRLPTLLKSRAWAVYDSLGDKHTDTYPHLKAALLARLCPETEEDRMVSCEKLMRRQLRENESIDELAHDIEKLFDRAYSGLPDAVRDSELWFHFINSLPEKIALQLKLQAKVNFAETMSKARELRLIYERMEVIEGVSQLKPADDTRLSQVEETLQAMSQQLAALTTQQRSSSVRQCFCCGKPGHLTRNCRSYPSQVQCFKCGRRGHMARECWSQGNANRGAPSCRAGSTPVHSECSHHRMHTYTHTTSLCHTSCIHYWNCWSTPNNDFARLGCFLFGAFQ